MYWFGRHSVLWCRLVLVSLLCVVPIAALTVHLSQARRASDVAHAQNEAKQLVQFAASNLSIIIDDTRRILSGLVSEYERADHPALQCDERLALAVQFSSLLRQLVIANRQGEIVCSTIPLRRRIHIADREYFQRALTSGQFVMSDVLKGRHSEQWGIVAAQRFIDPHTGEAALLIAALDLDELNRRLARAPLPSGAILSIVDFGGRIAARAPGGMEFLGKLVREPQMLAADVTRSERAFSHSTTLDEVYRIVAFERLPSAPYVVRVGLSKAGMDAAASRVLYAGLLALAMVLALTLAVAWIASHYLVARPLRRITESAEGLSRGELTARTGIDHNHSVIGTLAGAFDRLAAGRQRAHRALKTLSAGNRTLLRQHAEDQLLLEMCRVAVDVGGYPLALVAYLQNDEARSVAVTAYYGRSDGFVENLRVSWNDDTWGQGTVGTAIRTGRYCVMNSLSTSPQYAPWRDEALKRGFRSVISLPLQVGGQTIGTFTLYAEEEDAFDAAEVELLDEMAADLSFGIGTIRERARQQAVEAAAEHARTHDSITGLVNRTVFVNEIDGRLPSDRQHGATWVVVLHLRRLQDVFDGLGYGPGDEVIREVGLRLQRIAADEHCLARVSFSDFGVLPQQADSGSVARLAHELLAAIQQPICIGSASIAIQGAVGSAFAPDNGNEAEILIRRAAIAAREGGRLHAGYYKYRGGIEREDAGRLALAAELTRALEGNNLALHFQPKFDVRTHRLCGREALIRWQHAERGTISPGEFIPVAEHIGLIRKVTDFVLDAGIAQQSAWLRNGAAVPLALNLSARDLHEKRLAANIATLLERHGVPPHFVQCEITESALIDDVPHAQKMLRAMRDLGMKVYVDDFGTGYCALSYLTSLPVSGLKIDRSFVSQMTTSARAQSIVASIVSMAHKLDLVVVAEGVETQAELDILREIDCDEAQGYLLGRPAPA
ncbi:MAG: EAL domain-containing protein [Rhodospirillaceae bacterium]